MKKFSKILVFALLLMAISAPMLSFGTISFADTTKNYYVIYDGEDKKNVLFLKGEDVNEGDRYLSSDNKLYEITSVDDKSKTAVAKFLKDEQLPKFGAKRKTSGQKETQALSQKKVGVYHTHNDESYYTPDGVDSVYGKGGIHDVGKALVENFEKLGIKTIYREDLHLPHNSGAYTRSQVTASAILNQGVDAIFDIHRDSTKRDYYVTKVDGKEMSAIRMVIGRSSANFEENQAFAYNIKGYADEVYPGLIKDIYIGKGNYNQQLSNRAMLFEFGCENIEKDYAIRSTEYLAKVLDVVLYGKSNASSYSLNDVDLNDDATITGLVESNDANANSNDTLFVVLGLIGTVVLITALVFIFSKGAREKVKRFFGEMFAAGHRNKN